MDHMNQEPADFAAALALLRKAREEIRRHRSAVQPQPLSDVVVERLASYAYHGDSMEHCRYAVRKAAEAASGHDTQGEGR